MKCFIESLLFTHGHWCSPHVSAEVAQASEMVTRMDSTEKDLSSCFSLLPKNRGENEVQEDDLKKYNALCEKLSEDMRKMRKLLALISDIAKRAAEF